MYENVIGLTLVGTLIALRALLAIPPFRRLALRHLRRWQAWAVERLDQPSELDELVEQMRQVARREKLRDDVRRVQRLLLTDMSMTGTRQIGNRIAYDWLLRDLERCSREVSQLLLPDDWSVAASPAVTRCFTPTIHQPRVPQVEILEIGWKS